LECTKRFQRPEEMSRGKGLGAQVWNEDVQMEEKGGARRSVAP